MHARDLYMKALDTILNRDENAGVIILSIILFSEYNKINRIIFKNVFKPDYTETNPSFLHLSVHFV